MSLGPVMLDIDGVELTRLNMPFADTFGLILRVPFGGMKAVACSVFARGSPRYRR